MAETRIDASITCSRYVSRFELLADGDDASVTAQLMNLSERHARPFLMPTGDRYALLVAKYQERLRQKYCFVIPAYATLDGIIDKARLYETARHNGIPHPGFEVVRCHDDIDGAIANVPTPCYIKPALAHQWRNFKRTKLERAETAEELRQVLESFVQKGLVAVPQEIIQGQDSEVISVSAYIDQTGSCLGWGTERKIWRCPIGAGDDCSNISLPRTSPSSTS